MMIHHLMVVGSGAMGSALIQGVLDASVCQALTIIAPHRQSAEQFLARPHVSWHGLPSEAPAESKPDIIVFVVKPEKLAEVLPDYRPYVPSSLFVSVAAGLPVAFYQRHLGNEARIVRVMPNLAAAFREAMTIGYADRTLAPADQTLAHNLFASVGAVAWSDDETLLDLATLVSGSGPAYFYQVVESLASAAIEQGLPADLACLLARQTAIGVGTILKGVSDSPELLRKQVTSPGGVTEAALEVLMSKRQGFLPLLRQALKKGVERAHDLAKGGKK